MTAAGSRFEEAPAPIQPTVLLPMWLLLLLKERPGHGYELAERVKALGVDRSQRAVYTAAGALERSGFVRGEFEFPGRGPARRVLELTPAGEEALAGCDKGVGDLRALVAEMLARYAALIDRESDNGSRRSRRRARRQSVA